MQREQKFRVIGLRENGERVVITNHTTREFAERIVSLLSAGSAFAELLIEANGDDEAP